MEDPVLICDVHREFHSVKEIVGRVAASVLCWAVLSLRAHHVGTLQGCCVIASNELW